MTAANRDRPCEAPRLGLKRGWSLHGRVIALFNFGAPKIEINKYALSQST